MPCGMSGGAQLFADFLPRIDRYHERRDFPAVRGVSYLSPHLRFGTVSIRQLVAAAHAESLLATGQGAAGWDEAPEFSTPGARAVNGGWQWAASTGCDAQPWFRIFNPVTQSEKFDPQGKFIRRYVPELADVPDRFTHAPWKMAAPPADYPAPIVDHAAARERTLARYERCRAIARSRRARRAATASATCDFS